MYRKPWEVELFQHTPKKNLALAIKLGHHLVKEIYGKKNAGRVPLPTAPRKGETMKFENRSPSAVVAGYGQRCPFFPPLSW